MKAKFHLLLGTALGALNFAADSAGPTLTKLQTLAPFAAAVPYKHKDEVAADIGKAISSAAKVHDGKPSQPQSAAMKVLKTMLSDVQAVPKDDGDVDQPPVRQATNGAGDAIHRAQDAGNGHRSNA